MNPIAYDLLAAVTALCEIIDQPIDKNGMIRVSCKDASKAVNLAQIVALDAANELTAD